MPLQGNHHGKQKICYIICIFVLVSLNSFAQNKKLAVQEEKLNDLYSKMVSFYYDDFDSLTFYEKKFDKDFKHFIKKNPSTLKHNFTVLYDETNNPIHTSSDGKFRIYSWDTENHSPVRAYKSIYQWQGKSGVFTNISNEETALDEVCAGLHTVVIENKTYYLVITTSVGSAINQGQSIAAYRIEGDKLLDKVKVFKTKTETLNSIIVNTDRYKVVDDHDQSDRITYDAEQKIVSVPLVNEEGTLTNKFLLYQLKGRYFEYIGTTPPAGAKEKKL